MEEFWNVFVNYSTMEENFNALEKYNFWTGNSPALGFSVKDTQNFAQTLYVA